MNVVRKIIDRTFVELIERFVRTEVVFRDKFCIRTDEGTPQGAL